MSDKTEDLRMKMSNGDNLSVSNTIDSDGELLIQNLEVYDCIFYINKENAEKLVNHLSAVFSINVNSQNSSDEQWSNE